MELIVLSHNINFVHATFWNGSIDHTSSMEHIITMEANHQRIHRGSYHEDQLNLPHSNVHK